MQNCKNNMEKDVIMDLQMKMAYVLIIKGDLQIIIQKSDLGSFFLSWIYSRDLLIPKGTKGK